MRSPYFSIVIPTFNRADLLQSAVQSVLLQTFDDSEIVVSDNHSTDNTAEVVSAFGDRRIRYIRPPRHLRHVDHFEFVRLAAQGKMVLLLGDDDALVGTALEQFWGAARQFGSDFLFCRVAEYRASSFPGPAPNTLDCPPFSGIVRSVDKDEYLRAVFAFRPKFTFHPTAYVFSRTLADRVAARGGQFFKTDGIEAYAWPMAAAFAKKMVHIDVPLAILGRTPKSFGSNVVLCNPGKTKRDEAKADFGIEFNYAPLRTTAFPNFMCDGILGAKHSAPEAFASYEFDEPQYLRATMRSLKRLKSLGIDVDSEVTELLQYAAKYPALTAELRREQAVPSHCASRSIIRQIRKIVGDLGARKANERITAFRQLQKLRRGKWQSQQEVLSGALLGFEDILGCVKFLTPYVSRAASGGRPAA